MRIEDFKRWHWIVIGLVVGLVMAYMRTTLVTPDETSSYRRGISPFEFATNLRRPVTGNGFPWVSDIVVYPVLLAGQEILIGSLFVASLGNRVMYASLASFLISAVMLCLLTTIVQMNVGGIFETLSMIDLAKSLCVAGAATIATIVLLIAFDYSRKVLHAARQVVSHTS